MDTEAFIPQAEPAKKRGRPAKYASAAERQAAYRAANTVKTYRIDGKVAGTVAELAQLFECDETHVVNNLLRFALANRNWKTMGVVGGSWAITDKRTTTGKRAAPARDDSLDAYSFV
jgi:AT-hook transcription factor